MRPPALALVPALFLLAACSKGGDDTVTTSADDTDVTDTDVDTGCATAPVTMYDDADGDGFGDPATAHDVCEPDGEPLPATDCDDAAADVHPDAPELCNGEDDDCDGTIDEDPTDPATFYADADGDGHGDPDSPLTACSLPANAVATADDCDDAEPAAFPGNTEVCGDGIDNDCDGGAPGCLVSGKLDAEDAIREYDGVVYGVAGQGLAVVGDVDGDGVRDLLIGAPMGTFSSGGYEGRAYLVSGAVGGPLSSAFGSVTGTTYQAEAGSDVTSVGDVDGDGDDDLAVGAPGTYTGVDWNPGMVHVVAVSSSGRPSVTGSIAGTDATTAFGSTLAAVGDVNGDGLADLAVGAYAQNYYVGTRTGAVWLLTDLAAGGTTTADAVGVEILGPTDGWLGKKVANVGDVDGDGVDDLVATGQGAPGTFAWLLTAFPTGNVDVEDVAAATLTTTNTLDGAGNWAAAGGDVDGDGLSDVLVGAFQDDDGGKDAGAAYVFTAPAGATDISGAYAKLLGGAGDAAGISFCSLGDLDGDGLGDVAVGSWLDASADTQAGRVDVVLSPSGTANLADVAFATFYGDASSTAGHRVVAADLDGSGMDLIVAAPNANTHAGAVYVVPLTDL